MITCMIYLAYKTRLSRLFTWVIFCVCSNLIKLCLGFNGGVVPEKCITNKVYNDNCTQNIVIIIIYLITIRYHNYYTPAPRFGFYLLWSPSTDNKTNLNYRFSVSIERRHRCCYYIIVIIPLHIYTIGVLTGGENTSRKLTTHCTPCKTCIFSLFKICHL